MGVNGELRSEQVPCIISLKRSPIKATVIGTSAHRRALVRLRTSAVLNRACKKVLNFREHSVPSAEPIY